MMDIVRYPHIRDLREDKDLTQLQIADVLGITQSSYARYEIGQRDIPTTILIKLADYYGVSVDYLLDRTNKKSMR